MDPREQQFQSLNFCRRLYNFMKFLYRNAYKMMISDHRMPRRLVDTGAVPKEPSSQLVHPVAPPNEDEKGKTSSNPEDKKEEQQEEGPRAPKKTVSINENVETIINTSDKKKGKKKQDTLDDPKPLKSILKVSSDVNSISDSPPNLLSRANGA